MLIKCPTKDKKYTQLVMVLYGHNIMLTGFAALLMWYPVCYLCYSYSKPVSVARHILEHTQQSLVVGGGARTYAEQNGFQLEANDSLMTDETREKYQLWKESKSVELKEKGHDTLCKQLFWSNIL